MFHVADEYQSEQVFIADCLHHHSFTLLQLRAVQKPSINHTTRVRVTCCIKAVLIGQFSYREFFPCQFQFPF